MSGSIRTKKVDGAVQRNDGLENALSRKGVSGKSKSGSNIFRGRRFLSVKELQDIYHSGGIGAKVFTIVSDDITSKGFQLQLGKIQSTGSGTPVGVKSENTPPTEKIDGDSIEQTQADAKALTVLKKSFQKIGGAQAFNEAFTWARCYGGAAIVMQVDDGRALDQPLDMDNINKLESLDVYEGGEMRNVLFGDTYSNAYLESFGKTEYYTINTGYGTPIKVHESRVIIIQGRKVDSETRRTLQGWGSSELQPVYEELISLFGAMKSGEAVMDEMVIGTLKMENLDALCATPEGEALIKKRLDLIDTSKNNENTTLIGANEAYERHVVNLSNMDKLQQNMMLMVSGAADIPATKLFGRSPQGENATGESDEQMYNTKIASEQEHKYLPGLYRIFEVLAASKYVNVTIDIDAVEVMFNPLGNNSLYDSARSFDHCAKGWEALVNAGIFKADDARNFIENGEMGLSFVKNVRT